MMKTMLVLAAIYGNLVGGEFIKAPSNVIVGDSWRGVATLTESQANALGYQLLVDERPACASNEYAVAVGYESICLASLPPIYRINRTYRIETIVQPPRKFSKLKIYGAIAQIGKWSEVEAWLLGKTINGINGWTAFNLAQELSEAHPLFAPLADEARVLLGLSQAQFDALLNQCILED